MMKQPIDVCSRRRAVLGSACALLAIALPASADAACYNPDELSDGEQNMRQSLAYTDSTADRNKACRSCSYFKASGVSGCGQCLILNGSVAAEGHCDSWTAQGASR